MLRLAVAALGTAVLVITAGCADSLIGATERLDGSWMWVRSCGGFTGQCLTPASTGYTERLRFESSGGALLGGIVEVYRDDALYFRDRFQLTRREAGDGTPLVIHYAHHPSQLVRFEGEELVLIDECADCYENRYTPLP